MNHSIDTILDDAQDTVILTPTICTHMTRTSKWTKFVGGFFLVSSVIALIGSIFGILGFLINNTEGIQVAIFLLIPGGLGLYLGTLLRQYGKQLRLVADEASLDAMHLFLQKQRDFWRTLGILILVLVATYGCLVGYLVMLPTV